MYRKDDEARTELMNRTSRITGLSVCDYVRAMIISIPMSAAEIGKRIHISNHAIYMWRDGRGLPIYSKLEKLAELSGMSIIANYPELAIGLFLMENAQYWSDGFEYSKMYKEGNIVSTKRYEECLSGNVRKETLSIQTVLAVFDYFVYWTQHQEDMKQYRQAVQAAPRPSANEEDKALDLYHAILQTYDPEEYELRRARKNLWTAHTRKYYHFEFDLTHNTVRAFFKPTQALSREWIF